MHFEQLAAVLLDDFWSLRLLGGQCGGSGGQCEGSGLRIDLIYLFGSPDFCRISFFCVYFVLLGRAFVLEPDCSLSCTIQPERLALRNSGPGLL